MTIELFDKVTTWQLVTFGEATAFSKVCHLQEEVAELKHDIIENNPNKRLQYADCFILLFGAAASDGMNYDDICNAINEKMAINYQRKWGKPNADGVVNHIKPTTHE